MSFEDQRAVIIGASAGIGEATARSFAAAGAHVTITGRAKDRLAAASTPAGRAGRAEDVADAVLFLAGQGFMTGIVLPVTGGAHLVSAG